MSPVIFTEITSLELAKSPLFKLDDLFLNYDDIPIEGEGTVDDRQRGLNVSSGDADRCVDATAGGSWDA